MKREDKNQYVIGIDGGGTKTIVALADLKGKILKIAKIGPSSPVNIGVKAAAENISKGIKKVLAKGEIACTFIGLAAIQEEPRFKKEIKKELIKHKEISGIFKGKLEIGSDQIVAFRSGTDEKDGLLIIAGTGCVAHGWRKGKEITSSGWHWLADEGSAFWAGRRVFQSILKDLDGRGRKTTMTNLAFKKLKIKKRENLLEKIYNENFVKNVSLLSIIADEASKKGDKTAIKIMEQASRELALAGNAVIKKLDFQKQEFPLVLVGSMFKSKIVLNTVEKGIKKMAPRARFIRPKNEPVIGAVKLAIEMLNEDN